MSLAYWLGNAGYLNASCKSGHANHKHARPNLSLDLSTSRSKPLHKKNSKTSCANVQRLLSSAHSNAHSNSNHVASGHTYQILVISTPQIQLWKVHCESDDNCKVTKYASLMTAGHQRLRSLHSSTASTRSCVRLRVV